MEYSKEELNKVRIKKDGIPIHEIPIHFDYLEEIPSLKMLDCFDYDFKEWGKTSDARMIIRNKVIRYINFMYSMDLTCIKTKYPGYKERKVACAILAEFAYDPISGEFEKRVEKMLSCLDGKVNRMIISFLRHNYSDAYSAIVTLREIYYRGINKLLSAPETEGALIIEWTKTADALQKMEIKFLGGDETKPLNAALVKKIEEESLGLKPEDIAYKIKDGRDPFDGWDFYEKNILQKGISD